MLEPLDRRHLLESLRPPPGYDLDQAIGTTYSLDLMTLLTVPLAFALCDIEGGDGEPEQDPLALLEAVRRYAEKTHIFCQAGGIYLPKGNKLFLSHLESVVHEVLAPKGGVFHPKVWVLRFASEYEDDPIVYRVLVLSRNLTFDRSWDTVLLLEGELRNRKRAIRQSKPLGGFVEALPRMMLPGRPTKELRDAVKNVAQELRRVQFDLPAGFKDMTFHPIGLRDTNDWWFDGRIQRMLTISPFVDLSTADKLADPEDGDVLVSRLEQLQQLPEDAIKNFKHAFFLPQDAEPESEDDQDAEREEETLSGLHAKLFVADDGWNARIWTGSANATSAAMQRNVEFLVELTGKKSFCGVDAMLSQAKGETRFADLLSIYKPGEQSKDVDKDDAAIDRRKLELRTALATAGIEAEVTAAENDCFDVKVAVPSIRRIREVSDLAVRVWPVTMQENAAKNMDSRSEVVFNRSSFESLTSFFAFELCAKIRGKAVTDRFVLNLPVEGMPEDRQERVLRSMLKNRNRVMQFLLFLLAEDGDLSALMKGRLNASDKDADGVASIFEGVSLLEPLVSALHRDPAKLDRVDKVVDDLSKTSEGKNLFPEGFAEIWEPVLAARKELWK